VIHRFKHDRSKDVTKWSIRGALFLVLAITVAALGSGRMDIAAYGWGPPLTILGFGLVLMVVPPFVLRLTGRYDDDNVALSIEVALRNTAIGLLLVQFFFVGQPEQGHVLYTCLFYAGIGGLLCVPVLLLHRYGRSPVPFFKPKPRPDPVPLD
jgi:predicted Na+-dependent transporter